MDGLVYLPGVGLHEPGPLTRYLPVVPDGIAGAYMDQHAENGGWVLDPFGAMPATGLELARHGYRVLVTVNNPVTRFIYETSADPPSREEMHAALAELAATRKGEERLESHLQSLYMTECARCRKQVPAEAFVWDAGKSVPTRRIYHCDCGEGGEYPATEADQARAAGFKQTDGLHRSRALEQVTPTDDPDRIHVQQALQCYLPRAVYAMITIINKLEGISLTPRLRRILQALILVACDETNVLWSHPDERPRPRQLTIPQHFLEKNAWMALEQSMVCWQSKKPPVKVVNWPEEAGVGGGLHLFSGPVRDLAPHLRDLSIQCVFSVLPRPNQAFWTFSALWSGWLWGRGAANAYKSALHRRRYDWNWHAAALYAALKSLSNHLSLNTPFFAIVPEPEPAFLSAVLLAGASAGYDLGGMAIRTNHDPVQILWQRQAFSLSDRERPAFEDKQLGQAMISTLQQRGEPSPYLHLHLAGLSVMASQHSLRWMPDALPIINASFPRVLGSPEYIHHPHGKEIETGLWGLADWSQAQNPLSDRIELAVARFLEMNPGSTFQNLERSINVEFPGLTTPSRGLLAAILASYANEVDGGWQLRPEETPSRRLADIESCLQHLSVLAQRLNFTFDQNLEKDHWVVQWRESNTVRYLFILMASAAVGNILRKVQYRSENPMLVLPGGRAGLLVYKMDRDPSLKSAMEGWKVVKFRKLRRLSGMPRISRQNFISEIEEDPFKVPEQMKLF